MIQLKQVSSNLYSLVLIFFISIVSSLNLNGQSYFSDLDSLIYTGKFIEAENWLHAKHLSDTTKYLQINKYQTVLSWKDKVKSISDDTLKILLSPNMNQQQTFSLQKSGKLSNHYFTLSKSLFDKNKFGEALFYSKLALFYKIIFLSEMKEQVSSLLLNGFDSYQSISEKESEELVQKIEGYVQKFSFSFNQSDSLSRLKSAISEFRERKRTVDRSWNQKDIWNYKWKIGLEGSLVFSKMLDNDNLTVFLGAPDNLYSDFKISTPEIGFVFSESITLERSIFDQFFIGCLIGYSKFSYSSDQTKGYKFKDFDITGLNYGLRFSYVFREKIGVRPLGIIGFFVSDFERSESGIINNLAVNPIWKSKKEKILLSNVKISGGFEYINDKTSNISLSVMADFIQPIVKQGNFGSYNFSATMGIGYIF